MRSGRRSRQLTDGSLDGPRPAGIEIGEPPAEALVAGIHGLDHRFEAGDLVAQDPRLALDAGQRADHDLPALGRIVGVRERLAAANPGLFVLEQLADLGQGEPGVVTQTLDETQAVDVGWVV